MGLISEEDEKRYFNQLALQGVKEFLSEQTQYIQDGDITPLYENFCAVLAFASSKQKENAEKAQHLLSRLLCLQVKEGGFPRYLHEYPFVKYDNLQLEFYLVLLELLHEHGLALGKIVTQKLKKSVQKLLSVIDIEAAGPKLFKHTTRWLGEHLVSMRLAKEYEKVVERYSSSWHPRLGCYIGPALEEYYEKQKMSLSVFDYIMSSYYRVYPDSFKERSILKVQGALIKGLSSKKELFEKIVKGEYKEMPFTIYNEEDFSFFAFEKYRPIQEGRGFHLLRFIWKSGQSNHHLVCQSKELSMETSYNKSVMQAVFTYPVNIPEDLSKESELEFFIDRDQALSYLVNGKKATLFSFNDVISVECIDKKIEMTFSVEEGAAEIVGHISFGNRLAQIDKKASKELEAFDTRIQLRTLRRSPTFRLAFKMRIYQKLDCLQRLPSHEDHCLHTESLL